MPEPDRRPTPRAGVAAGPLERSRTWNVFHRAFGWWVPALFLAALVGIQIGDRGNLWILTAFLATQIAVFLWWVETSHRGAHASACASGVLLVGALIAAVLGAEGAAGLFLSPWRFETIDLVWITPLGSAVSWAVASWQAIRFSMAASRKAAMLRFIAGALLAGALLAVGLELETARVLR